MHLLWSGCPAIPSPDPSALNGALFTSHQKVLADMSEQDHDPLAAWGGPPPLSARVPVSVGSSLSVVSVPVPLPLKRDDEDDDMEESEDDRRRRRESNKGAAARLRIRKRAYTEMLRSNVAGLRHYAEQCLSIDSLPLLHSKLREALDHFRMVDMKDFDGLLVGEHAEAARRTPGRRKKAGERDEPPTATALPSLVPMDAPEPPSAPVPPVGLLHPVPVAVPSHPPPSHHVHGVAAVHHTVHIPHSVPVPMPVPHHHVLHHSLHHTAVSVHDGPTLEPPTKAPRLENYAPPPSVPI